VKINIYENVASKANIIRTKFQLYEPDTYGLPMEYAKKVERYGLDLSNIKTLEQLKELIAVEENSPETKTQRKNRGKVKVFENSKCKVYRIDTAEACSTYSSRGRWCITNANDWEDYLLYTWYVIETNYKEFDEVFLKRLYRQYDDQGDYYTFERFAPKFYNTFMVGVSLYDGDTHIEVWNADDTEIENDREEFFKQLGIPEEIFVLYQKNKNESYQKEMPWIKYGEYRGEIFDMEFEGLSNKEIINKILSIFQGDVLKDKYGHTLFLRTWTDKIRFYNSAIHYGGYIDYLKNKLGEGLYYILDKQIDRLLDYDRDNGVGYEDELVTE